MKRSGIALAAMFLYRKVKFHQFIAIKFRKIEVTITKSFNLAPSLSLHSFIIIILGKFIHHYKGSFINSKLRRRLAKDVYNL